MSHIDTATDWKTEFNERNSFDALQREQMKEATTVTKVLLSQKA
jgi:hypothetical protein